MTVTNHILAGAIIGLAIQEPLIALPLALLSHFVMDALPHFGYKGNGGFGEALQHRLTYWVGAATTLTTLLVVMLLIAHQEWLALAAGLTATLPDALGVYNYRHFERHGQTATGLVKLVHVKFHRAIQWCERPWGIWVELATFIALSYWLLAII